MKTLLGIPKRTWGIIFPLIIIAITLGVVRLLPKEPLIASFEECASLADSQILDTNPITCITRIGHEFKGPLPDPTPTLPIQPTPFIAPTPFPLNPQTLWQQISLPQEGLVLESPPNWSIELYSDPAHPLILISTRSGELTYGFALSRTDQNLPEDFEAKDITGSFTHQGWTGSRAQLNLESSSVIIISTSQTLGDISYHASWLQNTTSQEPQARYLRPLLNSIMPAPAATDSALLSP